ncbi:phospholipase B [Hysterangium stoloniferum]|nr:phospholipase B [Hysterangium stoloniferum]
MSTNQYSTTYAPTGNVACPDPSTLLRTFPTTNQTLSAGEQAYIAGRAQALPQAWRDWLGDGSQLGYNLTQFGGGLPKVGIAGSGGGFRAAMYAAGILNALDGRNTTAKSKGTGGLLQVADYIAGVSGGSWVASSMIFNGFPQFHDLVLGNNDIPGMLLDIDIVIPDGINILNKKNQDYYGSVLSTVYAKADAGFDTSITDPWARLISYHFLNGTTRANFFTNDSSHGAGLLWSDIPNTPVFKSFAIPFPIIASNSRASGSNVTDRPPLDSTVYEITPYEMGSFDPSLSAMANLTFVGTHLVNGRPANDTACVQGFDQASFMIGTVSSLFNIALSRAKGIIDGFDDGPAGALVNLLNRQLTRVTTRQDDVANWPNPFQAINPTTYQDANATWLQLVDGGENAANLPLDSLFVKARNMDVVVAIDTTAETTSGTKNNFPNGTAIRASRDRITTLLSATHQGFPAVPDDFATTGVNLRPTFFGCDPTQTPPEFPLLIYFPNAPPVNGIDPVTNTGAFKTSYTIKHQNLFLDQCFSLGTSGFVANTTSPDPNFPQCLQCAAIDRARLPVPIPRSEFCQRCFTQYCYDPKNPPSAAEIPGRKMVFVDPDPSRLTKAEQFVEQHGVPLFVGIGVALALLIGVCAFL